MDIRRLCQPLDERHDDHDRHARGRGRRDAQLQRRDQGSAVRLHGHGRGAQRAVERHRRPALLQAVGYGLHADGDAVLRGRGRTARSRWSAAISPIASTQTQGSPWTSAAASAPSGRASIRSSGRRCAGRILQRRPRTSSIPIVAARVRMAFNDKWFGTLMVDGGGLRRQQHVAGARDGGVSR